MMASSNTPPPASSVGTALGVSSSNDQNPHYSRGSSPSGTVNLISVAETIVGESPGSSAKIHLNSSATCVNFMEGPLSKWTNVMKGWQFRWFVLDENTGLLSYYTVNLRLFKLRMFFQKVTKFIDGCEIVVFHDFVKDSVTAKNPVTL